jgi:hypothetical protein
MLMPVITARGLASAVAIPLLALALAACGSGSGPGPTEDELSNEQVVLASYERLEGESYQMETTMTINGLDVMSAISTVEGEAGHLSQDLYLSAFLQVIGEGFAGDPDMAGMESMFTDVHTDMIMVDGVVYMQLSGGMFDLSEQFGADAWFTIDLAEVSDLDAIYEQIGGFDLAAQTELLLNDVTEVEETGDGVYTGTLSEDSELVQSMLGPAAAAGPGPSVLDAAEVVVTVDSAGLLKTMELTVADVEGLTLRMFSEVIEVGGAYSIGAPDSDNIHSFEELIGAMMP